MKKIYVVSLDDEVPLSDKIRDEVKVLCYLVYDEIKNYEYTDRESVLCHDNIKYNELFEKKVGNDYVHWFQYDDIESGMYEPFMVGDRAFAFTVNEGMITDNEIADIIHNVRRFAQIRYNFNINSVTYDDDKKKNRLLAIKNIFLDSQKKEENVKVRTKSILPVIGLILR